MADCKSAPLTQQFETSLSLSSISPQLGINTAMESLTFGLLMSLPMSEGTSVVAWEILTTNCEDPLMCLSPFGPTRDTGLSKLSEPIASGNFHNETQKVRQYLSSTRES